MTRWTLRRTSSVNKSFIELKREHFTADYDQNTVKFTVHPAEHIAPALRSVEMAREVLQALKGLPRKG
jgi:hypothetical protein